MRNPVAVVLVAVLLLFAPTSAWAGELDELLYRIGPGDVVAVQVYGEGALSDVYTVSSTGELDFPLVGMVFVEGRTTAEVSALLSRRLMEGYLNNPHVTVSVSTYASRPVQVHGAVAKPGMYFLQGPTTALQILSLAGGASGEGLDEVRITRGGEGGETIVVSAEQLVLQGADAVMLAAGDIVFVPQSLVSIMGHVGKPGEITFREGLNLSSALAAAGGALPTANLRKVHVLRGDVRIQVNVRKILAGKQSDFQLHAGDRVIVKQSVF